VFGKYKIQVGTENKTVEVRLDASVGVADWHPGETIEEVVEKADQAMYLEKNHLRMRTA
jgi:PleD family two-component response regulator